jgi:hypothetical protein
MSGMAILLLCTLQTDHSGWRSQPYQRNPIDPAAAVQTGGNDTFWGQAVPMLERVEKALEDGVTDAQDFLREQRDRGVAEVREAVPDFGRSVGATAVGSSWTEIERVLSEPASSGLPSGRSTPKGTTLRERIRRPEDVANRPPVPPADTSRVRDQGASSTFDGGEVADEVVPPHARAGGRQRYLSPPDRDEGRAPPRRQDLVEQEEGSANRSESTRPTVDSRAPSMALPSPPDTVPASNGADLAENATPAQTTDRPWAPLLMAVLALFASIGFNLYLSWIAWDLYSRYQDAADDIQELEAKLEAKQQEAALTAGSRPAARHTSMASG